MTVFLTEEEKNGLMEAIDCGISERNDYQAYGNPHKDYGDEWPDVATEKARRWDNAAAACLKLEASSMAEACAAVARSLRASAMEAA